MRRDTPCKECVFAKYEGITQTGCHLNMVEKFREVGAEVLEAYDEDKEFYVIRNRLCHFFRPKKWGGEKSVEECIEAVRFETKVPINAIVFVEHDYRGLKETLASFYRQSYKPAHITVVRSKHSQIWPNQITDLLQSRRIQWRLENLRQYMTNWQAFHRLHKFCTYPYHAVFHSGYRVEKTFFEKINNAIINDLKQFAMIEGQPSTDETIGNGLVIPTSVYEFFYFKGDPNKNFVDNVRENECQTDQKLIQTRENMGLVS